MSHMLRPFKETDQESVKELILDILSKEYPFDKSAYSDSDLASIGQAYGGERNAFFVIEEDRKVAGTVGVKGDSKNEALIRRLFVDSNYRFRGYGTELLDQAIKFCQEKGYKKVYFRCTDRMEGAMRLCRKKGFVESEALAVGGFNIHKLELAIP